MRKSQILVLAKAEVWLGVKIEQPITLEDAIKKVTLKNQMMEEDERVARRTTRARRI
jgi:hypothetical protein